VSVRPILELGDPALRQVASSVAADDFGGPALKSLIDDLIETMRWARGAGIAAPQIGVSERVCVIEVNDNPRYPYKRPIPLTVLVNPTMTVTDATELSIVEGCLSVPGLRGRVRRAARVEVHAFDADGAEFTLTAEGLTAGTLQHELDHLDGLLFVDRLVDSTSLTTWANYDTYLRRDFERQAAAINAVYPEPLRRRRR
jgi:peptide deformylase